MNRRSILERGQLNEFPPSLNRLVRRSEITKWVLFSLCLSCEWRHYAGCISGLWVSHHMIKRNRNFFCRLHKLANVYRDRAFPRHNTETAKEKQETETGPGWHRIALREKNFKWPIKRNFTQSVAVLFRSRQGYLDLKSENQNNRPSTNDFLAKFRIKTQSSAIPEPGNVRNLDLASRDECLRTFSSFISFMKAEIHGQLLLSWMQGWSNFNFPNLPSTLVSNILRFPQNSVQGFSSYEY